MPFTLSHPAAVLPLLRPGGGARGPLVASALVAGSTAPDVPYYADSVAPGMFGYGALTHAWWGVPTVDVLITAVLVLGWHGLLRGPLVALLPPRWAHPADALTRPVRPWRQWARPAGVAWFALSAAVGAATHVGWDAFTHPGRAGVRLLPVLDRTAGGVPLYQFLQYGSSAVALGVLVRYGLRELRRAAGTGPPAATAASPAAPARTRRTVLVVTAGAALLGAALRILQWWPSLTTGSPLRVVPTIAFGGAAGAALAVLGYAVAAHARRPRAGADR
ncbi:DUF4184 family protein [Kitasatospora sp. NPDC057223]|uniref:DUF4184 family protein n=1 Tax=Kitasatospora sp. NPDC057223 TaxID=3346055 RepID=UPI00362FCE8E